MTAPHRHVILPLLALLALAACNGGESVRQTLGLNREAPDEFKVVSRPPLSLPPDYELRPPSAAAPAFNSAPADRQARSAVTGTGEPLPPGGTSATAVAPVSAHGLGSNAETNFLDKIGAKQASPDIRETLYQDQQAEREKEEDSLLGGLGQKEDGALVDAPAEAGRIQEKKQAGEKVTGDDARTRKDKARSVLDQIF